MLQQQNADVEGFFLFFFKQDAIRESRTPQIPRCYTGHARFPLINNPVKDTTSILQPQVTHSEPTYNRNKEAFRYIIKERHLNFI